MNNAEQIGKMLEGFGFVPYHMNQYFQKEGFGQHWQKWSKDHVEVFRKSSDQWKIVERTNTGWLDIYVGNGGPSLIRSILEVNGLVEANPKNFREELADLMERHEVKFEAGRDDRPYLILGRFSIEGIKDFESVVITPKMLRGKAE